MVRIGVLGCGRVGVMHAANITAHAKAHLAAVYDINRAAADAVSASTGAPVMDSATDVFAAGDVDAVLIATATDTHVDLLELAVAAGKPVLCEKPIDLSLDRVNCCAETIRGTTLPIQIGFVRRFDSGHKAVFDAARGGEIGAFVNAIETGQPVPVGFEDGRLALVLADAAVKSLAERRSVNVQEIV